MVVVFVAVHGVKVTAPLIGVAYLFAVGVGHRQHSSPAVVLVIHTEAELLVAVGQDDDTGLSCDIAQRVIREFMAPRAVADMDGTPFGGAAGAVCVCHIVSRHVAITFVQHPVVCVVVKNFPKWILLLYQIARVVVGVVASADCKSCYSVGLDC